MEFCLLNTQSILLNDYFIKILTHVDHNTSIFNIYLYIKNKNIYICIFHLKKNKIKNKIDMAFFNIFIYIYIIFLIFSKKIKNELRASKQSLLT